MSAFICSDYHISALAAFAASGRYAYVYHNGEKRDLTDPKDIADILYEQNLRSVNERYQEQEVGSMTFNEAARYASHTAVAMLKAAHCYNYQACETEDYGQTLAKAIIEHVINRAIHKLPGYEEAEWGLSKVSLRRTSTQ